MRRTECNNCEKFRCDFIAQTCPLIAPVLYVLQQVSCSYEMIPNVPKHYETHRNMSLGSNRVDQVCQLLKIPMRLLAQTCALIAPFQPVLHRVSSINETLPNAP